MYSARSLSSSPFAKLIPPSFLGAGRSTGAFGARDGSSSYGSMEGATGGRQTLEAAAAAAFFAGATHLAEAMVPSSRSGERGRPDARGPAGVRWLDR